MAMQRREEIVSPFRHIERIKYMKINLRKQAGLAVAAAFALSAFMPSASAAPLMSGDSVTIANGVFGTTSGGEFAITYATGSFVSFCLETDETIDYGSSYTVTLNSKAIGGGSGVAANTGLGDVAGSLGVEDPLSNATAWLYLKYLSGALLGQAADDASANKAQKAIWFLEDEAGGVNNSWAMDAIAAVGAGWTNPVGVSHVHVLNLTDASGAMRQDQLYVVAIPEPETYAMLLAGLGLMGFVARRRQRKSAAV
jgi:hypothetical protein